MKKVTFVVAAFILIGLASPGAEAQDFARQEIPQTEPQQIRRELITQDQLPAPVQATLKSGAYQDWTVGEVYRISSAAAGMADKAIYDITLMNEKGQTSSVRVDENGMNATEIYEN